MIAIRPLYAMFPIPFLAPFQSRSSFYHRLSFAWKVRHLEIMPSVSGLERCPSCHPERSEGSGSPAAEILRCAQDDRPSLHMSTGRSEQVAHRHLFILDGG